MGQIRLQILLLFSAMLASLTGLVVGERPVQRAQIESQVLAQAAAALRTAPKTQNRPASLPVPVARLNRSDRERAYPSGPTRSRRDILLMKRSWLE